jgi:hypothetical protein
LLSHSSSAESWSSKVRNPSSPPAHLTTHTVFFFFLRFNTATRPHDKCERYLDVYTFTPSPSSDNGRTFFASDVPFARIDSNDLLTVFGDDDDDAVTIHRDVLELTQKDYDEFSELSSRKVRRLDAVWAAWKGKFR